MIARETLARDFALNPVGPAADNSVRRDDIAEGGRLDHQEAPRGRSFSLAQFDCSEGGRRVSQSIRFLAGTDKFQNER